MDGSIFSTLPLEIRIKIYAYLMIGSHISISSPIVGMFAPEYSMIEPARGEVSRMLMDMAWADVRCDNFDLTWLNYPRPLMETSWADCRHNKSEPVVPKYDFSILRVSRDIYEEASKELYEFSEFTFGFALFHLNKQTNLELGDLERNLHRMRNLDIIISEEEDLFKPSNEISDLILVDSANRPIIVGITNTLKWFARRTTSLRRVSFRFYTVLPETFSTLKSVLHDLLPATDLPETLCAFNVTQRIDITIYGHVSSFPYRHYNKWALYVAEKKDWVVQKKIQRSRRKGSDKPGRITLVIWRITPKNAAWGWTSRKMERLRNREIELSE